MKFFTLATLVATALAVPAPDLEARQSQPCPGNLLYGQAQCCETSVADVALLQCKNPRDYPNGPREFTTICRDKAPKCCTIVLLGIGLLCQDPIGVRN